MSTRRPRRPHFNPFPAAVGAPVLWTACALGVLGAAAARPRPLAAQRAEDAADARAGSRRGSAGTGGPGVGGASLGGEGGGAPMTNAEKIAVRQAVRRKSVLVGVAMPDGRGGHGSGFVVWRSGATVVLVTNAHVAKPGGVAPRAITVRPFGGAALPAYLATALDRKADGLDFAFLVATDPAGALGEAVEVAPAPAAGDPVIAVGNPLDEAFLVDAGAVAEVEATPTGARIYHTALIDHGSSGGGLFDAEGRLVGVNTYVTTAPGEEQQGVALAAQPLLDAVRIHAATVAAQADGWQETGIVVRPGAALNVIATGTWKVSPFVPALTGGGLADPAYARYSVDPAVAHGALLAQVGADGPEQPVDRWWRGAAPGASFAVVRGGDQRGTLRFRINDQDVTNNSGRLAVTVLEWRGR